MTEEAQTLPHANIDVTQEWQKPRLVAILFCEGASVSTEGKANIWNIYDRIFVDPAKKNTGVFTVVIITAQTPKDDLNITIIAPNNETVAKLSYEADEPVIAEDRPTYVQFFGKVGLHVELEGVYWFDVSYQGRSLGGAALTMKFQETEVSSDEHGS